MKTVDSIDEYIADFPQETQVLLMQIRETIAKVVPEAKEKISYSMPTFDLKGNLVHFAAYKSHIGFYPTSSGIIAFKEEISKYKNSKGAVQFPIDKLLPLDLIIKIVKFRAEENLERATVKMKLKINKKSL
jgi:uncharacterized protein YdhG (YjbR/CyaY superfamily)